MRFIFRGTVWPYFFIGYILAAVIGLALAALHVYYTGGREHGAAVAAAASAK
jgi:mannose/fructose/N-acetylgalactosamine-specific phosphotransferase system component IIC